MLTCRLESLLLASFRSADLLRGKQKTGSQMQQQVSPGDDTTDSDHGSHQRLLSLNHSVFTQGPEAPPPPRPLSLFSDSRFFTLPGSRCCCYATAPTGGGSRDEITLRFSQFHSADVKEDVVPRSQPFVMSHRAPTPLRPHPWPGIGCVLSSSKH